MKAIDVSWLKGDIENHRLKRPVAEARKNLHEHELTGEEITVIWREFRELLSHLYNLLPPDPRRILPQMATDAFDASRQLFSPLHTKYTDHEFFNFALVNKYSPLIEFARKHSYQKILSICILKEAFYGNADAAFSARDDINGADKINLSKLFSKGGKNHSPLDEKKLKRVYDMADTLRSEGYKDDCMHKKGYASEIKRGLEEENARRTDEFKKPVPSLNTIKDYLHIWNEVNNFYLGELPPLISMKENTKDYWVDRYKK